MTLWLHAHGGYPSYEQIGLEWDQWDFDAYKFIQALKGNSVSGYATLQRPNGGWLKIEGENTAAAFQIFGEWGAKVLDDIGLEEGHLVPVPSSTCLELGGDEKGRKLAQAITNVRPNFKVLEALHWHKKLPKSAEGGPRDVPTLLANLRIMQELPEGHLILIDDVVTTGGHLRASASGLRHFGGTVELALCGAQTVNDRPKPIFAIAPRDLEGS